MIIIMYCPHVWSKERRVWALYLKKARKKWGLRKGRKKTSANL